MAPMVYVLMPWRTNECDLKAYSLIDFAITLPDGVDVVQEDSSGNIYEDSNGHIAKFAMDNRLTGSVYEKKTSIRVVS